MITVDLEMCCWNLNNCVMDWCCCFWVLPVTSPLIPVAVLITGGSMETYTDTPMLLNRHLLRPAELRNHRPDISGAPWTSDDHNFAVCRKLCQPMTFLMKPQENSELESQIFLQNMLIRSFCEWFLCQGDLVVREGGLEVQPKFTHFFFAGPRNFGPLDQFGHSDFNSDIFPPSKRSQMAKRQTLTELPY